MANRFSSFRRQFDTEKICVGLCLSVALFAGVAAQDSARAQSAIDRASERIRALQREADALASHEKTLLVELRKLEIDRRIKAEEVTRANAELADTQAKLAAT